MQEFDWDPKLRGMVLGSFFYGYISTQILGAYLSRRFGGARLFGIGVAASALFTLITPPLARLNVYFLVALRILEGMFQVNFQQATAAILAYSIRPLFSSKVKQIWILPRQSCMCGEFAI